MTGWPTNLWRLLSCGALGCALAFGGCGSDSNDSDEVNQEPPGLLFVQQATGGTIEGTDDKLRLTLNGVDPTVTFFSDRPERIAGQLPARAFVELWDEEGFKDDPPNAALTIAAASPGADVFVLELERPRFLDQGPSVVYEATPVTEVGQTAAQERLDPIVNAPASFGSASLLIDDVPPAQAAASTAQTLMATADSLPDPGGSAKLSSLIAGLQTTSNQVASQTSQLKTGSSSASSIQSYEQTLAAMAAQVSQINALIEKLKQTPPGSLDISTMFQLQLQMSTMSQYLEACSSTLSAVHQAMITMARATKGQ